jgi:hypothetical protein
MISTQRQGGKANNFNNGGKTCMIMSKVLYHLSQPSDVNTKSIDEKVQPSEVNA